MKILQQEQYLQFPPADGGRKRLTPSNEKKEENQIKWKLFPLRAAGGRRGGAIEFVHRCIIRTSTSITTIIDVLLFLARVRLDETARQSMLSIGTV